MLLGRFARWGGTAALASVAALSLAVPAQAQVGQLAGPHANKPPAGAVSATPVSGTPRFPAKTKGVEQVRQLVECGGIMYAVGSFSQILQGGHTSYTRNGVFSFSASAPYTVTSWNPDVSGTVDSIAFVGNCDNAYIGGQFKSVGGTKATDIAEVAVTGLDSGKIVKTFGHSANGEVETLLGFGGHLIVGGYFTTINNTANKYMTSLNPATGLPDGYLNIGISGHFTFKGVHNNPTRVYNQALWSGNGQNLDLVMGDYTTAGRQPRQQIFMLNLNSTPHPTVTSWYPTQFNSSCSAFLPFYVRAAAWSPDGRTVYTADTGTKPGNSRITGRRTGLCDSAAAFPATMGRVTDKWINYTGCDSLYSAAASSSVAYFSGHERWSQNPNGCNFQGKNAITAPGLEGVSPANGALFTNSSGRDGYYSRDRGLGSDDMIFTGTGTGTGTGGLWIANDNYAGSQNCGGQPEHAGICFLPNS